MKIEILNGAVVISDGTQAVEISAPVSVRSGSYTPELFLSQNQNPPPVSSVTVAEPWSWTVVGDVCRVSGRARVTGPGAHLPEITWSIPVPSAADLAGEDAIHGTVELAGNVYAVESLGHDGLAFFNHPYRDVYPPMSAAAATFVFQYRVR